MLKRFCIRGLKEFKRGCPQTNEGSMGCPCWKVLIIGKPSNPLEKESKGQCIDIWNFDLQYDMLRLLEGNQEAIERFRNAMVQSDPIDPFNDNKASPKPDPALIKLVNILEKEIANREAIISYKVKELIEHKEN